VAVSDDDQDFSCLEDLRPSACAIHASDRPSSFGLRLPDDFTIQLFDDESCSSENVEHMFSIYASYNGSGANNDNGFRA
jgi:hypothetical protein